jgi:limonene 1,2-monooxygenase
MMELGAWIIGTPDDAIAAIDALWERTGGGFGAVLVFGQEWGGPVATHRSYELLARHVAPHFQGSLTGLARSNAVARAKTETLHRERTAGIERAQSDYERASKPTASS